MTPDQLTPNEAASARGSNARRYGWIAAALALMLALGFVAAPWLSERMGSLVTGAAPVAGADALADRDRRLAALEERVRVLEALTSQQPAAAGVALNAGAPGAPVVERLARTEGRLDALDAAQQQQTERLGALGNDVAALTVKVDDSVRRGAESLAAITGGAERAQQILLVTAARRALERGQPLGAYEVGLRQAFGVEHSAAVEAVLQLSRAPVTIPSLQRGLAAIAPGISGSAAAAGGDWWDELLSDLKGVIDVRRTGAPAAVTPATRVARAQARLAAGDVDGAVAQVAALPPSTATQTAPWLAAARRQVTGMRALDELEAAALAPAESPRP